MHRYEPEQVEQMFDGLNWLRFQQYANHDAAFQALQFLQTWYEEWKAKMKTR